MPIADQIDLLIALQKLDKEIFKLNKELASQPVIIAELEAQFKQKEADLKKAEENLKALAVLRKERELELETKEAGIKKLQGQLYQIKTNKEYQAMEREIASQKADVSILEEGILKVMEQADEAQKEIARQKEILKQHNQKFAEDKNKINLRFKEIEVLLQTLNEQRAGGAQKIDKEFLSRYERILNSKDGVAMVPVEGDACGGCNINLPPQVINEVRLKEELIFCGACARILYTEE